MKTRIKYYAKICCMTGVLLLNYDGIVRSLCGIDLQRGSSGVINSWKKVQEEKLNLPSDVCLWQALANMLNDWSKFCDELNVLDSYISQPLKLYNCRDNDNDHNKSSLSKDISFYVDLDDSGFRRVYLKCSVKLQKLEYSNVDLLINEMNAVDDRDIEYSIARDSLLTLGIQGDKSYFQLHKDDNICNMIRILITNDDLNIIQDCKSTDGISLYDYCNKFYHYTVDSNSTHLCCCLYILSEQESSKDRIVCYKGNIESLELDTYAYRCRLDEYYKEYEPVYASIMTIAENVFAGDSDKYSKTRDLIKNIAHGVKKNDLTSVGNVWLNSSQQNNTDQLYLQDSTVLLNSNNDNSEINSSGSSIQQQRQYLIQQIDQLNNDNATLTAQKLELQKEIEKINLEKGQLNAEMAKLQEKCNKLEEDNKDLQNKNTEFKTNQNLIEQSIQQSESQRNKLQQEFKQLQKNYEKLQKDTKALQNVKDDLENNNQTIENLTQEIDNLKKANKELNNENVKLKCEQDECDKNKQSVEELKKAHENQLNNLKKQNQNEIDDCKKQLEEKINELNNVNAKLKLLQGLECNCKKIVDEIKNWGINCVVVGNNSLNVFDGLVSEQMCDSVKDILSRIQNQYQNYKTKSDKCSKYERLWNDLRRKCSNLESELQALRNQPKK